MGHRSTVDRFFPGNGTGLKRPGFTYSGIDIQQQSKHQATRDQSNNDWLWQTPHNPERPISELLLDQRLLDSGRFLRLPIDEQPPARLPSWPGKTSERVPISPSDTNPRFLKRLDQAMERKWRFLHDRTSASSTNIPLNSNTAHRYIYNQFGIRQLLSHVSQTGIDGARVMLLTGYETPLHELLDCEQVAEVVVIDATENAARCVAERYAGHPGAGKLKLKSQDISALLPEFQEDEIARLQRSGLDDSQRPKYEDVLRHFSRITETQPFSDTPFGTKPYDLIHAPFVLGSLYLTPLTILMAEQHASPEPLPDYSEFLSSEALRSAPSQEACMRVADCCLNALQGILAPNGRIIFNIWARPQTDYPALIRLSDTFIAAQKCERLLGNCQRLFTGNPQPTLPHTVGHIFSLSHD